MMCFTLDSNCIIDLEESRPDAVYLMGLIELWESQRIELAIVSVSASENQPSGQTIKNYAEFEAKLDRVGLLKAKELPPLGIWDFGYWDHMLWSSEESDKQVNDIRNVLFPETQPDPPKDPAENSRWRNQMCDVLIAWAHAFHGSDCLVTRDDNFHRKADRMRDFGIDRIVTPQHAVEIASGA